MRIAIVNWTSRKAGGAESYLERVMPELRVAGCETAMFSEVDLPANRGRIQIGEGSPMWCASVMGLERTIAALREWHPDVIYGHGLSDPNIEARTVQIAPAIFFAHGYRATCISTGKTFKYPVPRPCSRRFGWQCLKHFYPHRCGGLSPLTMWTDFWRESHRLNMIRSYQAILTASEHMRSEYLRHGFGPETVRVAPLPVTTSPPETRGIIGRTDGEELHRSNGQGSAQLEANCDKVRSEVSPYRLLFVGRMEFLKGGTVLLDALPLVLAAIEQPLQMTFVGDGPDRAKWEEKTTDIQSREPRLKVQFSGWLEGAQLKRAFVESDLLVVPSLWPEPFGLVGPEAGVHSLPAAGFAVGGIPEWLMDGVNGYLAPGDPPTVGGLAQAITKCLRNPGLHAQLRRGALTVAQRFSLANHMKVLTELFESLVGTAYYSKTAEISNGLAD